jgi:hypothetical protein
LAGKTRQNGRKNANDHEQQARVHPAQPCYFVAVPARDLEGESTSPFKYK